MAERVKIKYGDVAPEAKENFVSSVNDKADFVNLADLQQYNLRVGDYANPCELYQTILDGSQEIFPEYPEKVSMGLWSNSISQADGTFAEPIVLTLQSKGNYSSQGLTFTFDTENNIFPTSINIKWYQGERELSNMDFTPNSAFYFCRNFVQYYNRVVITFNALNMPYNRLKLRAIDYGYGTFFYADELQNVKIIQEINPISQGIVINTCDFTLISKSDMQYSFQAKQPLFVYFNNELIETVFVTKSKRKAKRIWDVKAEDYIGILDGIKFMGGMYNNQNASELLSTILTQAKVPFEISDDLLNEVITGHIPIGSCREALQKICFAIGAVADTSNSDKVKIFKLSTEISQNIPKSRIMQKQTFEDNDRVTEVKITEHSYETLTTEEDWQELFEAPSGYSGQNVLIEFSEPMHSLSILRGSFVIDENGNELKGANYAIINANSQCWLGGKPYKHTEIVKSKKNPNILASDIENIKSISDETLVSSANIDNVLNSCYDYYIKMNKINMSIVEGKNKIKYGQHKYGEVKYGQYFYDKVVEVGDVISAETEYLGTLQGRIISERFSLNGGIIVKECEMV